MEFILDANFAYLILIVGVLCSLLAVLTPGTGLLEVVAFFCLALSGFAVYKLPFNFWALLLMGLSMIPFIVAVRMPKRGFLLGLSILGFVIGSVFLYAQSNGLPAVNPILAIVVSVIFIVFLWFTVGKSIQAIAQRPTHDLGLLVGATGQARTSIHEEGSVQIGSELWSARSDAPIPPGSDVRVVRRDGFVLVVEKK